MSLAPRGAADRRRVSAAPSSTPSSEQTPDEVGVGCAWRGT